MTMNISELVQTTPLIHDQLNPALWTSDKKLDPKVRSALIKIADRFYEFLDIHVHVEDVILTGSQTSYNYTDQSDLDLHLIVDYGKVQCDQPVAELFDTKRRLWKELHHVQVHGIPVEPYAEDLNHPVKGHSYSLTKNQWVVEPQHPSQPLPTDLDSVIQAWITVIKTAMASRDLHRLEDVKNLLKKYRKLGLAQEGELGRANLVYKALRNLGAVDMLITAARHREDQLLSLAESRR
jgi:hypothetical protein